MPKKILTGVVISDKPNKTITLTMKTISTKLVIRFQLLKANRFLKIKNFKLWRMLNNDTGTNRVTSSRQYWC